MKSKRRAFQRKVTLGHYNATRAEWREAYRRARIEYRQGGEPDPTTAGVVWKAALIVNYERSPFVDPLEMPILGRLASSRMIDEILRSAAR